MEMMVIMNVVFSRSNGYCLLHVRCCCYYTSGAVISKILTAVARWELLNYTNHQIMTRSSQASIKNIVEMNL